MFWASTELTQKAKALGLGPNLSSQSSSLLYMYDSIDSWFCSFA